MVAFRTKVNEYNAMAINTYKYSIIYTHKINMIFLMGFQA